jgi:hypothetical protein
MVTRGCMKTTCTAWKSKICMRALKIHLRVLKNHCAQLQKFSRTNWISRWSKKEKDSDRISNCATKKKKKKKKNIACKDFLRLTQGGRETKLPASFLQRQVLHRLPCNLHWTTTWSKRFWMASTTLERVARTEQGPEISFPFLHGLTTSTK